MGKVNFIFGVHNHQPVGNFGSVFEDACERSYLPLIDVLSRHPKIKWNLHSSGVLWDWLKSYKSGYLAKVRQMVEEGRLEILTGGFYEPVLSALPDSDKMGQIAKLSEFIKENFGFSPEGLWLTERVWEPHLPKILADSGVRYTVLDDAHFNTNGIPQDKLNGYFTTDEQGRAVNIFSISKKLRYMIPFSPHDDCIHFFQKFAEKNNEGLLVMADDGEKFGLWPDTYEHVYKHGWLDKFFTLLENHSDWIQTWKFGDYMKKYPSRGTAYIPSASYFEMSEWTLPSEAEKGFKELAQKCKSVYSAEECQAYLRSANWRNFFVKYSESNNMHKKMLYVSSKVNAADKRPGREAFERLWAGQCNCAYWHGVFGGLYLPHLREAVYQNLIAAECAADSAAGTFANRDIKHTVIDYNSDGSDEIILEDSCSNYYFAPSKGGALVEWDNRPALCNITNVLTRRFEPYHDKIKRVALLASGAGAVKTIHDIVKTKQDGLEEILVYDWHEKLSFLDHFLHDSATLESFSKCRYGEQGNFVLSAYGWRIHEEKNKNTRLKLFSRGNVWIGSEHCPVLVNKEFEFLKDSKVEVSYGITNLSARKMDLWFAPEMNFMLERSASLSEHMHGRSFQWPLAGNALDLCLEFEHDADLWKFPIETVSQSEDGFEKTYQGATIAPNFKFSVDIAATFNLKFKITVAARHD